MKLKEQLRHYKTAIAEGKVIIHINYEVRTDSDEYFILSTKSVNADNVDAISDEVSAKMVEADAYEFGFRVRLIITMGDLVYDNGK